MTDQLFPDLVRWKVEDWATGARHLVEQEADRRCPFQAIIAQYPEAELGARRIFDRVHPSPSLWMICDPATRDKFPRWAATLA